MTTLAAALVALPLAIGFGEGSELRQPLGVAIIGGLIASQILTLMTTPVVYVSLYRLRRRHDDVHSLSRLAGNESQGIAHCTHIGRARVRHRAGHYVLILVVS